MSIVRNLPGRFGSGAGDAPGALDSRRHGAGARAERPGWRILVAMLGALLFMPMIAGCSGGEQEDPAHGGRRGQGGPGQGPGVQRAKPAIPVAVAAVTRGTIASYYSATATLEPNRQAEILARVSGVVLDLGAEEGDFVNEGQLLLRIEEDEYRHRLTQAEAEEAKQRTRHERLKQMFDRDLVSAEEFESARSDLQAAGAAKGLAALEFSHTKVTAPFNGQVVQRFVDPGQMVNTGVTLFDLADVSRLLARVHVPAKEFRSIQTDQPVELTLNSSGETLRGRIVRVSPVIDPTSGTIKVTVEITEYPGGTRPGDFAEVRIVTDRHAGVVLVPKIAVFTEKREQVAYVAADTTAQRRLVEIGFQNNEYTEIVTGISEGERVVVQGQRSLEHGQPLKILERMNFEAAREAAEGE